MAGFGAYNRNNSTRSVGDAARYAAAARMQDSRGAPPSLVPLATFRAEVSRGDISSLTKFVTEKPLDDLSPSQLNQLASVCLDAAQRHGKNTAEALRHFVKKAPLDKISWGIVRQIDHFYQSHLHISGLLTTKIVERIDFDHKDAFKNDLENIHQIALKDPAGYNYDPCNMRSSSGTERSLGKDLLVGAAVVATVGGALYAGHRYLEHRRDNPRNHNYAADMAVGAAVGGVAGAATGAGVEYYRGGDVGRGALIGGAAGAAFGAGVGAAYAFATSVSPETIAKNTQSMMALSRDPASLRGLSPQALQENCRNAHRYLSGEDKRRFFDNLASSPILTSPQNEAGRNIALDICSKALTSSSVKPLGEMMENISLGDASPSQVHRMTEMAIQAAGRDQSGSVNALSDLMDKVPMENMQWKTVSLIRDFQRRFSSSRGEITPRLTKNLSFFRRHNFQEKLDVFSKLSSRRAGHITHDAVVGARNAALVGAAAGAVTGGAIAYNNGQDVAKGAVKGAMIGGAAGGAIGGLAGAAKASRRSADQMSYDDHIMLEEKGFFSDSTRKSGLDYKVDYSLMQAKRGASAENLNRLVRDLDRQKSWGELAGTNRLTDVGSAFVELADKTSSRGDILTPLYKMMQNVSTEELPWKTVKEIANFYKKHADPATGLLKRDIANKLRDVPNAQQDLSFMMLKVAHRYEAKRIHWKQNGASFAVGFAAGAATGGKVSYGAGQNEAARAMGFDSRYCFRAGTVIELADGMQKMIEDIVPDDFVMAFNGFNHLEPRQVVGLKRNTTDEWIKLSAEGLERDIYATPSHEMFTPSGEFKRLKHLIEDAKDQDHITLVAADGAEIQVKSERISCDNETTYNFEVYDLHTYIAGGLRVHNDSVEGALETGGSSAGGRGIGAASANMSTPIGQDSNKPTEAFKEARKAEKAIAEDANRELEVNSLPGTDNDIGDGDNNS